MSAFIWGGPDLTHFRIRPRHLLALVWAIIRVNARRVLQFCGVVANVVLLGVIIALPTSTFGGFVQASLAALAVMFSAYTGIYELWLKKRP